MVGVDHILKFCPNSTALIFVMCSWQKFSDALSFDALFILLVISNLA